MKIWFKDLDLKTLKDSTKDAKNMTTHLGIEFIDLGDDSLTARMPVDDRTKQPYGLLHGGASCVLAETLGSFASALCIDPAKFTMVGLEINANHIRAVREGFVVGVAKPIHIGRKTHIWDIRIETEADHKLVCVSRLTVAILDK